MALNKDAIKDRLEVREFPVHAKYGDKEFDYTGVVLVIPNGLRWSSGRVTDATIGAVYDDVYGPGVHWDNKQEAEKWLSDNWDKLYLDSTRDGWVLVLPREDDLVEKVVKKTGNIESMTRDILMEELTPDLVKKIAKALERNKALTSTYALTVSVEDLLSTNRNSNPSESGFYFILEGTRSGVSFFYNNNLEFSRKPNSKSVRVVKRYNNIRGFEESFWLRWAEKWLKNDLVEKIVKKSDGYYVTSEDGKKNLGGPYDKEGAEKRLQQVHYFKNLEEGTKTKELDNNFNNLKRIEFYDLDGSNPVQDFILDIKDVKLQAKIIFDLKRLDDLGNKAKFPLSRYVEDGILEMRTQQGNNISRVFYFFIFGDKIVMTNGYIKKSQKADKNELKIAKKRRDKYMTEKTGGTK